MLIVEQPQYIVHQVKRVWLALVCGSLGVSLADMVDTLRMYSSGLMSMMFVQSLIANVVALFRNT
jgi:hypothetical protein